MTSIPEKPADKHADASAFWRFSLKFYALPGVAPACLEVQDRGGADVNLLLFLLFLANDGKAVDAGSVARLDAAIRPWREEVVVPLRRIRRKLKEGIGQAQPDDTEIFRTQIKKVELESERLEQGVLEEAGSKMSLKTVPDRAEAARINLAAYSTFCGGFTENPLKFLMAAFTDLPP